MTALGKIKSSTLQEQVYLKLKDAIFDGHFFPGDFVTIRFLADQLGTSVMPVRYAIQRLITETALEVLPNRTVRFPMLSWTQFEELIELRALLDVYALEKAFSGLSEAVLGELELLDRSFDDAVEKKRGRQACEANRKFHFTLYSMARNDILFNIVERIWIRSSPAMVRGYQMLFDNEKEELIKGPGHSELIAAIKGPNVRMAKKIIRDDAMRILSWIKPFENEIFQQTNIGNGHHRRIDQNETSDHQSQHLT